MSHVPYVTHLYLINEGIMLHTADNLKFKFGHGKALMTSVSCLCNAHNRN